jgi:hypothetical protein
MESDPRIDVVLTVAIFLFYLFLVLYFILLIYQ